MADSIKAIETSYKGYRFRSRLEARWAVFLDDLKIPWEYEREGFSLPSGPYLPDFWLPVQKVWLEIKPGHPDAQERAKAAELVEMVRQDAAILCGPPGEDEFGFVGGELIEWYDFGDSHEDLRQFMAEDPDEYGGKAAVEKKLRMNGQSFVREQISFSEVLGLQEPARIDRAVAAARSARFEHGETPHA